MEDLIHNAHTLFDERPSQSPPETASTQTYSSLFLSPESADVQAMGSTSRHRPRIDDGIHASSQSSSAFPSDGVTVNCFAPPQATLTSPLRELSVSKMHTEGVKTTTQERLTKAKGTKGKSRVLPHSDAPTIPQSPPESILSSAPGFPLSSATSLQTRMGSP